MSITSLEAALPKTIDLQFGNERALVSRAAAPFMAAARGLWQFAKTLADAPNELRRMADELEATRPEAAARMRRALNQGWGA